MEVTSKESYHSLSRIELIRINLTLSNIFNKYKIKKKQENINIISIVVFEKSF